MHSINLNSSNTQKQYEILKSLNSTTHFSVVINKKLKKRYQNFICQKKSNFEQPFDIPDNFINQKM